MKCVEMLVIRPSNVTRACSARALGKRPRWPQAQEQVGQIAQQQNRGEIEQDAGGPGAGLDPGVIVEIGLLQRSRPVPPSGRSGRGQEPVHLRQRVQDETPVRHQRVRVGREASFRRAGPADLARFSLRSDLLPRVAHELEHGVDERADFRRHASCRPRSWLACVKYASEFWSSALSDLNASTRASCRPPRQRARGAGARRPRWSRPKEQRPRRAGSRWLSHAPTGADQRIVVRSNPARALSMSR